MTTSSSYKSETRTGFLRPEFEAFRNKAETQSVGFLANSQRLEAKSASRQYSHKKKLIGGDETRVHEDPLFGQLDTSITQEQADAVYEASRRRELEIRRRMAAPGRDGLFMR